MTSKNEPPVDPALLGEWVRDQFRKAAPMAVNAILELVETADSEQVRLQAAKDALGLFGVTQKQSVEVDHGVKKSQEEVDHALKETLKKLEAGRQMPALPRGNEDIIVEKADFDDSSDDVEFIPVIRIEDDPEENP